MLGDGNPLFAGRLSRREMMLTTGGALAVILLPGCGDSGEGGGGGGSSPIAGSFVGEAAKPNAFAFAAVIAAKPEQQGESRAVRAYLCSAEVGKGGQTINEWFTGAAKGNDLELASEGGAKLKGKLGKTASGEVTLKDGKTVAFDVGAAAGFGGLYNVNVLPKGQVSGSSESGGQLKGALDPEEGGLFPANVTITASDAKKREIKSYFDSDEPGEFRWIVLNDGTSKGAKLTARTGSTKGAGFSWPHLD